MHEKVTTNKFGETPIKLIDPHTQPPQNQPSQSNQNDGKYEPGNWDHGILQVIQDDQYLKQFEGELKDRQREFHKWMKMFSDNEGGLINIARSYTKYGLNQQSNGDIEYMEWAPNALSLSIFGEFNNWNREEFQCKKSPFGQFTITIKANPDGTPRIRHESQYKIQIEGPDGKRYDKQSAWSRFNYQNPTNFMFNCVYWNPPQEFQWTHKKPSVTEPKFQDQCIRIYEAHVGMAQEFERVSSYQDFALYNLDRIKDAGYNVIQLMAIQEHAYYASFGYHVTGFFGISSRSGSPDDFKFLVNEAHKRGLRVIIDCVHSHASNNVNDGIHMFDGTDSSYSKSGPEGYHSGWDSMLFDYSKYEVKRFLLSNLAWFLEEYNVDGFRFDAITSVLYKHHGIGYSFTGNYEEYFGDNTDLDGIVYLMLANKLIKQINPDAITIAEDVSGQPTLCREIKDGGIGFDYRLNMYMPDMWIKLLKQPDEYWNMGHITHNLSNRRWKEKVIGYCESHDQAIVGDKTISMQLFDAHIYTGMSKIMGPLDIMVQRGIALHKMIRLISFVLGGEGYLNFMGNEFGHPEWIDFPREGNNDSFKHCRRQWNLLYDKDLVYEQLGAFDKCMNHQEILFGSKVSEHQYITLSDEEKKLIVFEKGDLLYIFNFHYTNSYENQQVGTNWHTDHFVLYDTEEERFQGLKRLDGAKKLWFKTTQQETNERPYTITLYIPSRTAIVLCSNEVAERIGTHKIPEYPDTPSSTSSYIPKQNVIQAPISYVPAPIVQSSQIQSQLKGPKLQPYQSANQNKTNLQEQIKQKQDEVKKEKISGSQEDNKIIERKFRSLMDELDD